MTFDRLVRSSRPAEQVRPSAVVRQLDDVIEMRRRGHFSPADWMHARDGVMRYDDLSFSRPNVQQDVVAGNGFLTWGLDADTAREKYAIMRDGVLGRRMGRVGSFHNTFMDVRQLYHAPSDSHLRVIVRPASALGAGEVFSGVVAAQIGAAHRVPASALREGGDTVMEVAHGVSFLMAGVRDGFAVEHALRRIHRNAAGDLSDADIGLRARIDRQLAQVRDNVVANADRHDENGIVSDVAMAFIDTADAGSGSVAGEDVLVPRLQLLSLTGPGAREVHRGVWELELEPEVVDLVRRADRGAIAAAHRELQEAVSAFDISTLPSRQRQALSTAASDAYLGGVMARLDHIGDTARMSGRLPDHAPLRRPVYQPTT